LVSFTGAVAAGVFFSVIVWRNTSTGSANYPRSMHLKRSRRIWCQNQYCQPYA
jgi:hypothetical protein